VKSERIDAYSEMRELGVLPNSRSRATQYRLGSFGNCHLLTLLKYESVEKERGM